MYIIIFQIYIKLIFNVKIVINFFNYHHKTLNRTILYLFKVIINISNSIYFKLK